jgi:glycerol-3-phosphate dehydrogenase
LAAGWTGTTPLPGGEFDPDELPALTQRLARRYPFLAEPHAARLVRAYGARASRVLGQAKSATDLGRHFGATLTETEVRYLIAQEWAVTAEDVLWRRSKLGLHISSDEAAALEAWMRETPPSAPAPQESAGASR